ncbi:MAG: glycoside hydrolase [Chloroflexi bacterium]|nr:glycoside hydrolase [Chloroflexota bacterium]
MLEKQYLDDEFCEVTFILPTEIQARTAYLVGEFNAWERAGTPLLQQEDGTWRVTLKLEAGREYQYRYLVNGQDWHNDWNADKYVAHPYGGENSVVVT